VIWSSGEEITRFVDGFNNEYPGVKVSIQVIPNTDFLAKLIPVLSSGQGVPDLFTGESNYVKYLVDSGYWEDLRQAPYNVEAYTKDMWESVLTGVTDSGGAIRALSWSTSPGSIIYRRDLAEKYLGSGDPTKVSEMLSSNAKMLEVAATLAANGVKMFASWQDILNMQFSNRAQPWVVDGKLVIDPSMLDFMDMAKTIVTQGYDLNADPWTPEWISAVESDNMFCYVLPSWGYQYVVKPGAVKTSGDWGLAEGPVPYIKGGTWLGIYKDGPNKELAWTFLKYVCCNSDVLKAYAQQYGDYVSLKSTNLELAQGPGEDVLAGQNLFEFYNGVMAKIPHDLMTGYDGVINDAFLSATKAYATGSIGKDAAVAQFKADIANAYPELVIN